jgi:hypothetical protein
VAPRLRKSKKKIEAVTADVLIEKLVASNRGRELRPFPS